HAVGDDHLLAERLVERYRGAVAEAHAAPLDVVEPSETNVPRFARRTARRQHVAQAPTAPTRRAYGLGAPRQLTGDGLVLGHLLPALAGAGQRGDDLDPLEALRQLGQ